MRALAAFLMIGCSSQVDGNVPGFDRVRYIGDHDPRDVGLALYCFSSSLAWWTGDLADLSQLRIDEEDLPGNLDGIAPPGHITFQPADLSASALAHELMHEHLRRFDGDPDHDHASGDGPWTLVHEQAIDDAQDMMRRLGL